MAHLAEVRTACTLPTKPIVAHLAGAHAARTLPAKPIVAILLAGVTLAAGCGSVASHTASSSELALQRAQFVQVSHGLRGVEGAMRREVAAARGVWPSIAAGLPRTLEPGLRNAVAGASASAGALPSPPFMANAAKLTGPAAGAAGLYESYSRLAERGWRLTQAGIAAIGSANPSVASFERDNSSLYIDAIYDAHFNLSLLGKSLTGAYQRLGGAGAFGASLTEKELSALAAAYSIPATRLEPHPSPTLEDR